MSHGDQFRDEAWVDDGSHVVGYAEGLSFFRVYIADVDRETNLRFMHFTSINSKSYGLLYNQQNCVANYLSYLVLLDSWSEPGSNKN